MSFVELRISMIFKDLYLQIKGFSSFPPNIIQVFSVNVLKKGNVIFPCAYTAEEIMKNNTQCRVDTACGVALY